MVGCSAPRIALQGLRGFQEDDTCTCRKLQSQDGWVLPPSATMGNKEHVVLKEIPGYRQDLCIQDTSATAS